MASWTHGAILAVVSIQHCYIRLFCTCVFMAGEFAHHVSLKYPGGTCHVCIRGCACHVFGSEISLESHFLGSKICTMNFPILGGKKFQQLSFLLDSIL